jgi:hypothetical protein
MHGVGAYVLARHHDFRVNPEDPNLWQHWANLAQPRDALKLDFNHPKFVDVFNDEDQRWEWCNDMLYNTPGNDPDAFLLRYRRMLVALGVVLGALVAWWGWQLGGAVAALAAAALFCLDPNFLAHAPMVKNDTALSLVALAMALSIWRAGRRLTWLNAAAVVLTVAAGPATKFSGVLLPPIAALLLACRALGREPWTCLGRTLRSRAARLAAAGSLVLASAAASVLLLWACYDFRFRPSPFTPTLFDARSMAISTAEREITARHPDRLATREEMIAWRPNAFVRSILSADKAHLLPQTWLHGLLQTYAASRVRESFLCGAYSRVGFASYFPLAFLFKTPVATIVAVFAALGLLIATAARRTRTRPPSGGRPQGDETPARPTRLALWTIACLLVPPGVFLASAIGANLNIGLRHILPVYPPLFVLAGWAASRAVDRWGRRAALACAALALLLAGEVLLAAPDFLAFFNSPSGGSRGGLRLLSDSNLDWGQDLPALADWQRRNPGRRLYLCYFGTARPAYYGIRFVAMSGSNELTLRGALPASQMPDEPGVIAISATHLQGTYLTPQQRQAVAPFRNVPPTEVLNGTIYLFDMAAK